MSKSIRNDELKRIGIDLDDTIAHNSGAPDYILGEPTDGAKEFVEKLITDGWKPFIWTARPSADYQMIENWLIKHGIPIRRIVTGKELVYASVDDKNIEYNGDFDESYKKV